MSDVARKLAAARTKLVLDKPFLGALVLRLPLIESTGSWCSTSATDARSIYYNAEYIAALSLAQVQFVLAHEALHCGLAHFARREHRDINRWNIACDHAVNPLLLEDGLELPPGALFNEDYQGLSAEEIYPLIKSDSDEKTLDQHLYDDPNNETGDQPAETQQADTPPTDQPDPQPPRDEDQRDNPPSTSAPAAALKHVDPQEPQESSQDNSDHNGNSNRPPPLSAQERDKLNTQWQQRMVSAVQQASMAGKMNGSVARHIDRLLRSTVPWRTVLARFMGGASKVDYNMTRPTQRRSGEAILPSLHARQINVAIAVDTSGSIEHSELELFISEINAIKSLVNARITLLACDWQLDPDGPWTFEPWDQLQLPESLQGGGGTDFRPVFDWINVQGQAMDLVVYFTDACGQFPADRVNTETLWLVKGKAPVPWGQRIQLN